jgi:hypothetical protein
MLDTDDSLDELLNMGTGSSAGVQEKFSHSEGSPGDAGMVVEDKEMSVCLLVMTKMQQE